MEKLVFPKDFQWGAAVWAQGTEGAYLDDGKVLTVFEHYALTQPSRMQQGIGPFKSLDWYSRYKEYISYMKELKFNSFRTSISWARLMPDGETVNEKAVVFYRDMFKEMRKNGIKPWVVLYWFDMPLHLENKGGFSNREVANLFVKYATKCFELFHEEVDIFYVYNEPFVDVMFKYLEDMCYPNEVDMKKAYQAIYNMLVAHAKAVEQFKKIQTKVCKIGSVIDLKPCYPRSNNPLDLKASDYWEMFHDEVWLSTLLGGVFPERLQKFLKEHAMELETLETDKDLFKNNTISVLGINHYFPQRVKARETAWNNEAPLKPAAFFEDYVMHGRKMNKYRGWEIYPEALYDTLMRIKREFGDIECYITENGMGVQDESRFRDGKGIIEDDYRIEYVSGYLKQCHRAIEDGCNLKGYHMWSFIDLWSPSNQFLNCYGFVEFDPKEMKVRGIKKSGYWYKQIIENNYLEL